MTAWGEFVRAVEWEAGWLWYPLTWLGHSAHMALMVGLTGLAGEPWIGFFLVGWYYTKREIEQWGGAPWWDSLLDALAPLAIGLTLCLLW
jgi:hypothetical protein